MIISMRIWKIIILALAVFGILYICFYIWILQSVKNTLRTVYLTDKDSEELKIYISDKAMNKIYRREIYPSSSSDKISFSLSMGTVVHIFSKGKVWIEYTYIGMDKETNEVKYGSSRVPIRLDAELIKGKWKIMDKYEEP